MKAICVKQPRLLNLEGKRESIMQVRVFRKNSAFFGRKIGTFNHTAQHRTEGEKVKRTPPPGVIGGIDWAGVLTTCNWLPKLFKNLKLDFLK